MEPMTLTQYQEAALRTKAETLDLAGCALGLAGESGEFADIMKKVVYHGHPIDRLKLVRELGDVLWYLAVASSRLGFTLDDVARINIAKLEKRYPDGFSSEASKNRVAEEVAALAEEHGV